MVKDEPALLAAYDDRDRIAVAFNQNVLHRLNGEMWADFDIARFRHRAAGIPSRLESRCTLKVRKSKM